MKSLKINQISVTITQAEVENVYVYSNISIGGILQTQDDKIIWLQTKDTENNIGLLKGFVILVILFIIQP